MLYHYEIPSRHSGRVAIMRTTMVEDSIRKTIVDICREYNLSEVYVIDETEIVKALRQYKTSKETIDSLNVQVAALEKENKELKDDIMCKDTTINNALAVVRRQADKHKKEVDDLYAQIAYLEEKLRIRNNTINALLDAQQGTTVEVPHEAEGSVPDCGYYCSGKCKGQKNMPECTPYAGYCPVVERDSSK